MQQRLADDVAAPENLRKPEIGEQAASGVYFDKGKPALGLAMQLSNARQAGMPATTVPVALAGLAIPGWRRSLRTLLARMAPGLAIESNSANTDAAWPTKTAK